jgi:hypothetical protein
MLHKVLVVVCLIALMVLGVSGCRKSTPPPQPEEEVTQEIIDEQLQIMEMEMREEEARQGQ